MKRMNHLKNYFTLSLLFHLGLGAGLWLFTDKKFRNQPVEVVLLSNDDTQDNTKKPEPMIDQAKRIVETDAKNANELLAEKTKYLSAKNNTVEKETQAKLGETFQNSNTRPRKAVKAVQAKLAQKTKPTLFGEKFNAYDALEKKAVSAQNGYHQGLESTSTDKLAGVEQSLRTQLNTKEYIYYGYYQRIKKQLNQFWQPQVKQKVSRLLTQGRTIASDSNNKVTKLIIVLNDAGTLVKVQVLSESGIRDLDEAAIEAFRQAAPFPNPPKGMVENDGTIKIRWDFVVES